MLPANIFLVYKMLLSNKMDCWATIFSRKIKLNRTCTCPHRSNWSRKCQKELPTTVLNTKALNFVITKSLNPSLPDVLYGKTFINTKLWLHLNLSQVVSKISQWNLILQVCTFSQIVAQLESSDLIIKTLQSQLSDLQKSETILKAKQHHEQVTWCSCKSSPGFLRWKIK